MWIIVHQNSLDLFLAAMAARTCLASVISVPPGFLNLLGFGSLHYISIYAYCSGYSSEKT